MNPVKELASVLAQEAQENVNSQAFRSGHWDEPNVVAHMRTSMQPDETGRPTFLIDELQSDWGQKLREEGARDPQKMDHLQRVFHERGNAHDAAADNAINFINQHKAELDKVRNKSQFGTPYDLMALADRGSTADIQAEARAILEKFNNTERALKLADAERRTAEAAAPGHPLVNTTDQWTTTAIRRLLQQAAEADAAGIALTPGKVQAERFGLEQHISELYAWPEGEGLVGLSAYDHAGRAVLDQEIIRADKLDEYVGREMAQRIRNGEGVVPSEPAHAGDGSTRMFSGLDLKVGGSGMRYSYDQMYPKKIAKELKKLDPEHPGVTQRHLVPSEEVDEFSRQAFAEMARERRGNAWKEGTPYDNPFHYFELTPRVKEEIRKGLPLFEAGLPIADLLRAYYGDEKD